MNKIVEMKTNYNDKNSQKILFSSIRLVFVATVFILCLIANASITFGWFYSSKTVGMGGSQILAESPDFKIISVNNYAVTTISNGNYTFTNHELDTLPTYDKAGIEYSQYKPAIVIKLTYEIKNNKTFTISMSGTANVSTVYADENYTSNVIAIRQANVDASVNEFLAVAEENYTSLTSVNETTKAIEKNSLECQITELSYQENVAWFIFEYNESVMQNICDKRLLAANFTDIEYIPDITFIIK